MVKIGTDIDGVIAYNPLNKADYRPFRLHEYYSKAKPTKYSKMPVNYVISGRKQHFRKVTQEWLSSNEIKYKELIMFPNKVKKNNQTLAEYKSRAINELGITKYYEDDERIAEYLKKTCQNTKIIFIDTKLL
jgi:uncharacterized HAD superfamily protein